MKLVFKILLAVFVTSFASNVLCQEYPGISGIAIEYVGSTIKPVDSIVISDSKMGGEWIRSKVLMPKERDIAYLASINVVDDGLLKSMMRSTGGYGDAAILKFGSKAKDGDTYIYYVTIVDRTKIRSFWLDVPMGSKVLDQLIQSADSYSGLKEALAQFKDESLSINRHVRIFLKEVNQLKDENRSAVKGSRN